MKYKDVWGSVWGNHNEGNWLFLLISIHFFLFAEATKEWMTEKKETGIRLNQCYFLSLRSFFVEVFSWTGRGVRGIWRIILAYCESLVLSIGDFRIRHVCLWSVVVSSWRCYEQETSRTAQPGALIDACAPTSSQEKKGAVRLNRGGKGFWAGVSF